MQEIKIPIRSLKYLTGLITMWEALGFELNELVQFGFNDVSGFHYIWQEDFSEFAVVICDDEYTSSKTPFKGLIWTDTDDGEEVLLTWEEVELITKYSKNKYDSLVRYFEEHRQGKNQEADNE